MLTHTESLGSGEKAEGKEKASSAGDCENTSTPETCTSTPETCTSTPETCTSTPETYTPTHRYSDDTCTSTPETSTPTPETSTPTPETSTPTPETSTLTLEKKTELEKLTDCRFNDPRLMVICSMGVVTDRKTMQHERVLAITDVNLATQTLWIQQKPPYAARRLLSMPCYMNARGLPQRSSHTQKPTVESQDDKHDDELGGMPEPRLDFESEGYTDAHTIKPFAGYLDRRQFYTWAAANEATFKWNNRGHLELTTSNIPKAALTEILDSLYQHFLMVQREYIMNPALSQRSHVRDFESVQSFFCSHDLLAHVSRGVSPDGTICFERDEKSQTLNFFSAYNLMEKTFKPPLAIFRTDNPAALNLYAFQGEVPFMQQVFIKLLHFYGISKIPPSPQELFKLRKEVAEMFGDLHLENGDAVTIAGIQGLHTAGVISFTFNQLKLVLQVNAESGQWKLALCRWPTSLASMFISRLRDVLAQMLDCTAVEGKATPIESTASIRVLGAATRVARQQARVNRLYVPPPSPPTEAANATTWW